MGSGLDGVPANPALPRPDTPPAPPRRQRGHPWTPLREARLTWRFLYRDLSASVIPCALFTTAAARHHQLPYGTWPLHLAQNVGYMVLYLYVFCVSNQLTGIDEDRINKPDRPLVADLTSPRAARYRWYTAMVAFSLTGWALGVLAWTLLWQVVTVLHNFARLSRWWPTKNLCMVAGTIAQMAAAWQMVGPIDATGWRWILSVSLILGGIAITIQDLRDTSGDRATGRRTLPLALGEHATRRLLSTVMATVPLPLAALLYLPTGVNAATGTCTALTTAASWIIAARILRRNSPTEDHRTYMLFTYLYCLVLASGAFTL